MLKYSLKNHATIGSLIFQITLKFLLTDLQLSLFCYYY